MRTRLTTEQVMQLREEARSGRSAKELAAELGESTRTVENAVHGWTFSSIAGSLPRLGLKHRHREATVPSSLLSAKQVQEISELRCLGYSLREIQLAFKFKYPDMRDKLSRERITDALTYMAYRGIDRVIFDEDNLLPMYEVIRGEIRPLDRCKHSEIYCNIEKEIWVRRHLEHVREMLHKVDEKLSFIEEHIN